MKKYRVLSYTKSVMEVDNSRVLVIKLSELKQSLLGKFLFKSTLNPTHTIIVEADPMACIIFHDTMKDKSTMNFDFKQWLPINDIVEGKSITIYHDPQASYLQV